MGGCQTTFETYNQAFLAGTPDIAAEVLDFSYKMPMWLADIWSLKKWEANDSVMQQLVFRGSMPEVERGFDRWKKLASSAGCDPCVNDCSYNWTTFQGHGFERRLVALMRREFRTPDYCVNEIKSNYEFEQTFAKIIENIQSQVAFFKEYNIGLNFLTGIAKKLLVTSAGIKANTADPYLYPPLGTATLSAPNFNIFTKLYEGLRRRSDVVPFDIQNGQPIYAVSASDEILDALFIQDANARADLRFSSAVDALLTRYNFMSSIRGQFLNAPLLYPRRFEYTGGQWMEVVPFINGLPAEVGSFSDLNPAWENATYEEILVYGKDPFNVYYRDQITTVGSGSDFGPEPSFMNQWLWVNIQTADDEFRRLGHYSTAIEIALAPQFSGGVYAVMFPRPSQTNIASNYPTNSFTGNDIPAVGCPCPVILSATVSPFTAGLYTIVFGVPVTGSINDTVQIGIDSGGYVSGTLEAISTDGLTASIQFSASLALPACTQFVNVFCTNTLACSSKVLKSCDCRAGEEGDFKLILDTPIKAITANDVIVAYMGDGTTQQLLVVSADMSTGTWAVKYNTGYGPTNAPTGGGGGTNNAGLNCDRNGVVRVCVPTATNAACPACSTDILVACTEG